MHDAAKYGRLAQLNLVIELAPERINETDSGVNTPLHWAARYDREVFVSLLLSAKADVNATTGSGYTPLGYARGDRVRQLLIDAGA